MTDAAVISQGFFGRIGEIALGDGGCFLAAQPAEYLDTAGERRQLRLQVDVVQSAPGTTRCPAGLSSFQWPSETTSMLPSVILMAV